MRCIVYKNRNAEYNVTAYSEFIKQAIQAKGYTFFVANRPCNPWMKRVVNDKFNKKVA